MSHDALPTAPVGLSRIGRTVALACPTLLLLACGGTESSFEHSAKNREAITASSTATTPGTIHITGTIKDPQTGPQAGITITLSGSQQAKAVTDWSGSFDFAVSSGGSYSLTAAGDNNYFQPPFHSCLTVTPSIVNLNNLTESTAITFVGTGTSAILNCSPSSASGATAGTLTIQGKVTSGGHPVAGARVWLNGSSQAYRTTDETGAYSFLVKPGSYSVSAAGACGAFTPGVTNLNNLKANVTQNFQGTSCPPAPLTLCPTLDALVGWPEAATCDTVSTEDCAFDRVITWAGQIPYEFQVSKTNVLAMNDCRFGKWRTAPIVNYFTNIGVIGQQENDLTLFTLQLFGCALANNLVGPLSLQGSLIPPDLIRAGLKFTTADLSALVDEYMASVDQAFADFGMTPLSATQLAAVRAQLDYAASKTPGVIASSKLSYSTCP